MVAPERSDEHEQPDPEHRAAPPLPAGRAGAFDVPDRLEQPRVDPSRGGSGVRRLVGEEVVHPAADLHVLPQRHRSVLGQDDGRVPADLVEPGAELLGVAHGRGQGDHLHPVRELDEDLLPHRAAEAVGEVVDLVHDDEREPVEGARAGVDHVPQDLGRHDDDRCLAVDRGVTGEEADVPGAVAGEQVAVLLVRQRLDGRGVERLLPAGEGEVDCELPDDGLPRTGRRGDQHPAAGLQGLAGLDLETVELEVEGRCEAGQLRRAEAGTAGSGVPLGGRRHAVTLRQRLRGPRPRRPPGPSTPVPRPSGAGR